MHFCDLHIYIINNMMVMQELSAVGEGSQG